MNRSRLRQLTAIPFLLLFCCGGDEPPPEIDFAQPGPIAAAAGRGSFRFGVATAATQIEESVSSSDWYAWTAPEPDGLAKSPFVGDASRGYSLALDDVELIAELNLDVYRFSMDWSRIEPSRDFIDESVLEHYDAFIDALVQRGITPMITVHHFSSPAWIDDPRQSRRCVDGPTDTHLCGWGNEQGAEQVIAELAEFGAMLAARYGDRVDDWVTLNEPVNYLLASYGIGAFPPGARLFLSDFSGFMTVVRNYLRAHVALYDAIKKADTVDADGDGVAANVGFTLNVAEWMPARNNAPSSDPEDIAAAERVKYVYHHLLVESIRRGAFDADVDKDFEEQHPEWQGKLDWLGVQYYSRIGVSADRAILPGVDAMVCFGEFDLGSCVRPDDDTHWVPEMNYEYYEPGVYNVLTDFAARWPDLPLTVTESGLATDNGTRRAEHVVRSLEQIARAMHDGVDVRGYYHWSLFDNFEWSEGFGPRFGLYTVDFSTYARTATEGATVLGDIARSRVLTSELRQRYGGLGPLSNESSPAAN